ncbi:MAG: peptide deformylase [Cycloclasticus pugetii]|jgi:peptide deformylase|uniref:Peptide deformylase n=2 Tax=Cycloclasticus TaxID=34067 RepID=S5TCY1_9GAMM|nr:MULTISPECIES: peptide deformylase [Cycloclasticus]AFT68138.1 Peptide deformylase 1 [Cycloclasticus sp. P1]AGS38662.1 Peptide deformylase [Cycloclasticus zancles 78-ME]ATI02329.1 peptide deformylase [Cycloclasticus sp. PY97N]EPD12418.1 peptide deformylase 1 [Cycloclasticus pugetii]MBV1898177.1 peptide deformylase [Cycloclasticus sp.]|tara:strand:- start:297 stop:827 length:531 start_codon:yes stop_codon:yes gene_type:complete
MTKLNILHFPDKRLRTKATDITVFDDELRQFIRDMFETMYAAPGIGLAATQVNYHKRLIVIDVSEDKNEQLCLINPVITHKEGIEVMQEGCLSVPGFYEDVERAESVTISAQDEHGKPFELTADDLLAVCIQHEIDHLDGKLFVDYLSPLKRNRIRKKLVRMDKERAEQTTQSNSL